MKKAKSLNKKHTTFKSLFNENSTQTLEDHSLKDIKQKLDEVSPSMCLAKWLQVSLNLTTGQTHSCYHPPLHSIDKNKILNQPSGLHNTTQKKEERAQMRLGKRPKGCSYCWKIEDSGDHYSDRHYRSLEPWAYSRYEEVVKSQATDDILPSYVEVNFNQVCQFKCSYCSPCLSTEWTKEIQKFGAFPTRIPHNDISYFKENNQWPIPPKEFNPFVNAFWKWWPELYPQLKVFRMTGGEPLLDHNTFKILDYIEKHPNPDLELSLTTNLCPPKQMMDKFQMKIGNILKDKKIKYFSLFASIDTWGDQAEYIRYGLNLNEFENNIRLLLKSSPQIYITFIVTMNALSIFNLHKLLDKIIEWGQEDSLKNKIRFRRIFVDFPYLRSPAWQSLEILPYSIVKKILKKNLVFIENNKCDTKNKKFYGFSSFASQKIQRLIDIFDSPVDLEKQKLHKIDFYKFFKEYDRRRSTNFVQSFPELKNFWLECEKLALNWDKSFNAINNK